MPGHQSPLEQLLRTGLVPLAGDAVPARAAFIPDWETAPSTMTQRSRAATRVSPSASPSASESRWSSSATTSPSGTNSRKRQPTTSETIRACHSPRQPPPPALVLAVYSVRSSIPGTLARELTEVHVVYGQRLLQDDLTAAAERRPEGQSTLGVPCERIVSTIAASPGISRRGNVRQGRAARPGRTDHRQPGTRPRGTVRGMSGAGRGASRPGLALSVARMIEQAGQPATTTRRYQRRAMSPCSLSASR